VRLKKSNLRPCTATSEAFERIDIVRTGTQSSGNNFLIKYLSGEPLTRREAMLAACADCMGYYSDGRIDCEIELCPLYPFMPYRKK